MKPQRAARAARATRTIALVLSLVCLTTVRVPAQHDATSTRTRTQAPNSEASAKPIPSTIDSLRADSAAFAALPEPVREVLDVRSRLQQSTADPNLICVPLSGTSDGSRRQRVQGRLGDGSSLVVFARVDRRGRLGRVEFVRRLPSGVQRGYTWDAAGDATVELEWPAGSMRASSGPVPKGGPIPRAVRALGRLVLTWPCPTA